VFGCVAFCVLFLKPCWLCNLIIIIIIVKKQELFIIITITISYTLYQQQRPICENKKTRGEREINSY
jgi:hypothetical protein